jgi:GNAT superfamily N-acetyltransferase
MATADIVVRSWEPSDGPAIQALGEQSPDTGAVAFFSHFEHDAYATLTALNPGVRGVVAVAPDHAGIVGLALVTFGRCWYEGQERPFAYLSSLHVHPDYRGRGIASSLAAWRIDAARERFAAAGEQGVIFAGIQAGNTGSLKTAARWSSQRLDGHSRVGVLKVRRKPPKSLPRLEVRPVRPDELEQLADRQNAFYAGYNLYPADTAATLDEWRGQLFFGQTQRECFVAVDAGGRLVAGLAVTFEGPLITSHVLRMPRALRLANVLFQIVPPEGTLRRLKVERFWFGPGRVDAGRFLLESIRWQLRDRGTTAMIFFDPTSPLREAIKLPRLIPATTGSVVLSAPVPAVATRYIYLNP